MESNTLTERQLASQVKSKNYIPPEARNLEKINELRKVRKQAKRERIIQRQVVLEARSRSELNWLESKVSKDLEQINKDTKSLKVVQNMQILIHFILANPRFLDLLDELKPEFIPYLIGTRNKINMVLNLHKEKNITYKEKKEMKRPRWARRHLAIDDRNSD